MDFIFNFGSIQVNNAIVVWSVKPRPRAGPGVWLIFLLPLAILVNQVKNPELSESYNLSCSISSGLFLASVAILEAVLTSNSPSIFHRTMILPLAFSVFKLCVLHKRGFLFSLYCGWMSSYAFGWGVVMVMKLCPLCFSFGEAAILTQAIILFMVSSTENIYQSLYKVPETDMDIATLILQVGFLGVSTISIVLFTKSGFRSTIKFYALVSGVLCLVVIPLLQILLKQNPVLWILALIINSDTNTVYLVAYWLLCVGVAGSVITWQILKGEHATTALRKYFHVLAVAVYFPGLLNACCLLYLASGVVLALFIVLEMARLFNIPPLGSILQEGFAVYADEKDAGNLSLTPIYLLAGCSLPLWLHPTACSASHALLPLSSGLLSVGVGDTLASSVGSHFGRHKWPGTSKSIEGTIACAAGQFLTALILYLIGSVVFSESTLLFLLISIAATSIVEAFTDQVDNLVLPLLSYLIVL